jgi:hypothetical protein
LDQPSVGTGAVRQVEAVQRHQRAGCRDFEDRSTAAATGPSPARSRCSVQVPVGALDQGTDGDLTVRAPALGTKVVQRRQRTARRPSENSSPVLLNSLETK